MNGGLLPLLSEAQTAEALRRASDRRQTRAAQGRRHADVDAIVRTADEADKAALERLSQLEGRRLPAGPTLVAEIADPFRPTAELVELLGRALAHLRDDGRRRRWSLWGLLRRPGHGLAEASAPTVPGNELPLIR